VRSLSSPQADRPAGHAGLVIVLDDDAGVRAALESLLRSVGLSVVTFATTDEFLACSVPDAPACLVLDVRLRGASGLDLQAQLQRAGNQIPIVFISGFADIMMSVAAMKGGAVDFIVKPVRDQQLLDAVYAGLERDTQRRELTTRLEGLHTRFSTLSAREREVMSLAVKGLMNKQIADVMTLSEATVKIYRGQAMRKMCARSFAQLIIMAQALGLTGADHFQPAHNAANPAAHPAARNAMHGARDNGTHNAAHLAMPNHDGLDRRTAAGVLPHERPSLY
jgi:FixJ family two-component response regulator